MQWSHPGQDKHFSKQFFTHNIFYFKQTHLCIKSTFFLLSCTDIPFVFKYFKVLHLIWGPWLWCTVFLGVHHLAHLSVMYIKSLLLFSLAFYFSVSLSPSPSLPPFLSSLHCQTERVRHELIGRYWYVILPQRSPLPVCHAENEKKDEGARGQLGYPHPQPALFQLSWCWHSPLIIPPDSDTHA